MQTGMMKLKHAHANENAHDEAKMRKHSCQQA